MEDVIQGIPAQCNAGFEQGSFTCKLTGDMVSQCCDLGADVTRPVAFCNTRPAPHPGVPRQRALAARDPQQFKLYDISRITAAPQVPSSNSRATAPSPPSRHSQLPPTNSEFEAVISISISISPPPRHGPSPAALPPSAVPRTLFDCYSHPAHQAFPAPRLHHPAARVPRREQAYILILVVLHCWAAASQDYLAHRSCPPLRPDNTTSERSLRTTPRNCRAERENTTSARRNHTGLTGGLDEPQARGGGSGVGLSQGYTRTSLPRPVLLNRHALRSAAPPSVPLYPPVDRVRKPPAARKAQHRWGPVRAKARFTDNIQPCAARLARSQRKLNHTPRLLLFSFFVFVFGVRVCKEEGRRGRRDINIFTGPLCAEIRGSRASDWAAGRWEGVVYGNPERRTQKQDAGRRTKNAGRRSRTQDAERRSTAQGRWAAGAGVGAQTDSYADTHAASAKGVPGTAVD
ncbi:hypothetical protein B0H17DRAFT_1214561 [Mycena rosella]|uniref:Uncharacterized protein n=1 Tax=Mycena rosella TaxID=1033263 RepID=A0AAD7CMN6_MYCRO|nr:hypothetical protein B0H17DRAFT_1214561 [Mycena rosella]